MAVAPHFTVSFDEHLMSLVQSAANLHGLSLGDFARMAILGTTRRSLSGSRAASEAFLAASEHERKRLPVPYCRAEFVQLRVVAVVLSQ
jgi:hypothetical protein